MKLGTRIFVILLLCFTCFEKLTAQTFTPHYNTTIPGSSCNGFYDYLPIGYNPAGTQKYPLLIALHGAGERGDGTSSSGTGLPLIVIPGKGIASLINSGGFPSSVTVNGNTFSFIVICPQFIDNGNTWPNASDLSAVIAYATANYKVDLNRVYLAGLSMGGGVIFDYVTASTLNANQVAAIVPVCTAQQPGPPYAPKPDSLKCRTITASNLPVFASHNAGDVTVPSTFTDSMVHYINATPSPTPLAKDTIFTSWIFDHDAWTKTFDPNFTGFGSGMNMYQWMLQYQRPITPLPVSLKSYWAYRSRNRSITVAWETDREIDNYRFTIERSGNGKDFTVLSTMSGSGGHASKYQFFDDQPLKENYYRLSQTDVDGKTTYYNILRITLSETEVNLHLISNAVSEYLDLYWQSPDRGNIIAAIYGADGRLVKKYIYKKDQLNININVPVSNLKAGMYFLHISGSSSRSVQKFIKQ